MLTSKKRQIKYILWVLELLLVSCSFISNLEARLSATPTLEVTSIVTPTPPLPTPSHPIAPTALLTPTVSFLPTPTISASQVTFQIPAMPEAQLGNPFGQMLSEQGVSYTIVTPLESVRDFYRETLITQGWEWLYTDMGHFNSYFTKPCYSRRKFNTERIQVCEAKIGPVH